ncbi:small nuclear ribonucleoprotein Sm D3 [Fusarium piperis]|uniref:Small nuclear ribonucleoprotein Sm D3 n=1 Tax=Fusarium piperis TaxID=1435070 RepID=A0A9W9BR20_9HYPO|nr:small nuclear ribonucleoprotein Sm D3 [Fusarium piperis]
MNEANEPRRRRRHRLEAPQAQAVTALKPPASGGFRGTPTTQWSEWVLHASGSYYYRARYISYEETARVIPDGRNSIISDNVGGYIHYEFMGFNDAMMRNRYATTPPTQTPELSTCSGTTPTTVEPSPFQPLPRIQYKERDYISGPPAVEDRKMLMSGALLPPPKPENTYGKALVASKPRISRRKHQQQQQHQQQPAVPKKKERKKLEVDKRQMNSNVKVSKWLDSL